MFMTIFVFAALTATTMSAFAVDNYNFISENTEELYNTGYSAVTYDGEVPGYVQNLYDFAPQFAYDGGYGALVIAPAGEPPVAKGYSQQIITIPGTVARTIVTSTVAEQSPSFGFAEESSGGVAYPDLQGAAQFTSGVALLLAVTSADDVRNADGSIGTLTIPKINLTATAYDGDITAAMKLGAGLVTSTAVWNGNIGLVGHNRGNWAYFGRLNELVVGDTVNYTTTLGTKNYVVTFAGKIPNNDWSLLEQTADNRITLITCVANQPEVRWCVQAVEK